MGAPAKSSTARSLTVGSFERMPSESEFRAKAQQIANGINFLGGDILLLQEIETEICLNTLMEFLAEEGSGLFEGSGILLVSSCKFSIVYCSS